MKRKVYVGTEKMIVETTSYKDTWGKAVWVGEDGMTYELKYARLSKTWMATPCMKLEDGIAKGLYK